MLHKYSFKAIVATGLILLASACNHTDKINGAWVEPVPGMPETVQGFLLEKGGNASSIQMATLKYRSWKRTDNLLILQGESIGNHQAIEFCDTLTVVRLTSDSLIVKRGETLSVYTHPND